MTLKRMLHRLAGLAWPEPLVHLCESYARGRYRWLFRGYFVRSNGDRLHWFDHRINYALWPELVGSHWIERGVYSREVMRPGCTVLDLCCGDGFYPRYCFTDFASRIDAVDIEPAAIEHARRYNAHPKIRYVQSDIVAEPFPEPRYDVVCWDGAMGHFTPEQIRTVLQKVRDALGSDGVLTGYEDLEPEERQSWDHHVALTSPERLRAILEEVFPHVGIHETLSEGRHNAYFRCSMNPERIKRFA